MNKAVFVEGILFLVISLVGMVEGYRLMTHKDPYLVYGAIVPGVYVLLISIALMIVSMVHVLAHYREPPDVKKVTANKRLIMRMIGMVVVFAIYIILIPIVGYLIATLVFFVLEFRLAGIKSWLVCLAIGLVVTVSCYFIFVKYCEVIFPRGILWG